MDKTHHPDIVIILTYGIMAFCWAGKNMLSLADMSVCGASGLLLGAVTVAFEKTKLPTYICRGFGALSAALLIIEVHCFTGWVDSDAITVIASMIPPVAAGAMLVEGICTSASSSGRKKIVTAVLVSIFLAIAVFTAIMITDRRGLSVL